MDLFPEYGQTCKIKSCVSTDPPRDNQLPESLSTVTLPKKKLTPEEFYDTFVNVTEKQCIAIETAKQGSMEWKCARQYRITASDFAAAIGNNKYLTPEELVNRKVMNTFNGNEATEWGSTHERDARATFKKWFIDAVDILYGNYGIPNQSNIEFSEPNLLVYPDTPWMGVSPDGLVTWTHPTGNRITDLIEYKCPMKSTSSHPYARYEQNVPDYYKTQIDGIRGSLESHGIPITRTYFVVWQPTSTWITNYESTYPYELLLQQLKEFYFTSLLPDITHHHNLVVEKDS